MNWLTAIAAAIAKGVVQGYLEALQQRATAIDEIPNETDRAIARRIHDAILGLPVSSSGAGTAGSIGTAQSSQDGQRSHLGQAT